MYCKNCGAQLVEGAAFCPYCGVKLAAGPAPGKKRSAGFRITALILAAVMVVEVLVAGFGFPGFFTGRGSGGGGSVVPDGTGSGVQNGGDAPAELTIPSLEALNIDYTADEIASAPKYEMGITGDVRSAASGGFSVDFGNFNNMENDTFTVRELPEHRFERDCCFVRGYDLSLSSGRDEFAGEVRVTLPRKAADGDLVQFVTKDPETGENVYEYFETSEDGSSYILYVTHFSQHALVSISDFGDALNAALRSEDYENPTVRAALSAFYYKGFFEGLDTEVCYNPGDLWGKLKESPYLPSAYDMLQAMVDEMDPSRAGQNAGKADYTALPFFDNSTAAAAVGAIDAGLNVKTVTETLSTDKVIEGAKAAKSLPGKTLEIMGDQAGAFTAIIGFDFTLGKAINEVGDGKYDDYSSAMWGHWADNAGTAADEIA
ncbi:MAG: zinc ribbon domain-containing protein, partial [Clostridia bacterium]|nr:zinc ribbon domain-containing protein [Clostridia bacterium]